MNSTAVPKNIVNMLLSRFQQYRELQRENSAWASLDGFGSGRSPVIMFVFGNVPMFGQPTPLDGLGRRAPYIKIYFLPDGPYLHHANLTDFFGEDPKISEPSWLVSPQANRKTS